MAEFLTSVSDGIVAAGEGYLADTPVLSAHAGTQPDLFLRWNPIPHDAAAIDVVVHLHGFSRAGAAMALAEKVPRSGLDLSRRTRPTLAILPRGNWLRIQLVRSPGNARGRARPAHRIRAARALPRACLARPAGSKSTA